MLTSKRDNIRARESAQKSPGKQPEAQTGVIDEKRRIDSANVDAFQGSPRDQDQRDEVVPEDSTKLTADQLERLRLSIDIDDLIKYKEHRRQAKCDDSSNIFKKHRRPANCDEDTEEGTRLMIEDLERLRMSTYIHDLYKFKNNHRPANCSIQEDNLGSGGDELGANVAGNQAHEKVIRGHQPVQRDDNSKTDELGRGVNSKRRRIYAAKVDAKLWNDKFPYDKIADNQRDRNETEKVVVFGIETSLHLRIPERVKTITQHLPYVRDGLGHCDEGGHFVETTGASLVRVAKAVDRAIFHGDVRNRCLVSLDAGSGNGYPSMVFSQLFDKGFHIGAELCPGLVANSMSNLKALTAKGVVNLMDGKLDKEQVEQFGELAHNVPPRAFFVHGNLEAIEHLGGFDFVYGFDAVNSWETKLAMANAWNHPKSRRCMVVVSNSTEAEMEALGYKDIIFKEGVRVQFRTSGNESLVAHVYKRKSLRKCRHKYSFESPNAETCPMFAKAFELYRKGDEVARMTFTGYKKNTLLFDANLGSDPHSLMP